MNKGKGNDGLDSMVVECESNSVMETLTEK